MALIRGIIPSALALALLAGPALADDCSTLSGNLVANCGFETGDFTSWTQGGNTEFTGVVDSSGGVTPAQGQWQAVFGPVGSPGTISQTLATTLGTVYTLTFNLGYVSGEVGGCECSEPDTQVQSTSAEVIWDGDTILSLIDTGAFPQTDYSVQVVGGSSSLLTFRFRNDPSYFQLDNIAVTDAVTTPEPGSLGLLAMAAGLVATMRRRRA